MIIDILFVAILAYGFFLGYRAGIVKILLTFFSIFIGLFLAVQYTSEMNELIKDFFRLKGTFLPIVSFFMTFVVSMLGLRLFAQLLEAILKSMDLDFFNQITGGVVVASILLFLYSGMLWFLQKAEIISNDIEVIDRILGDPRDSYIRAIDPDNTVIIQDLPDTLCVLETLPNAEAEDYRYLQKASSEKTSYQSSRTIPFVNLFLEQFDVFMYTMQHMGENLKKEMKELEGQ